MLFATCVPPSAKKRKRTVPTYSPMTATKWLRTLFGSRRAKGIRTAESSLAISWRRRGLAALVKGKAMAAPGRGFWRHMLDSRYLRCRDRLRTLIFMAFCCGPVASDLYRRCNCWTGHQGRTFSTLSATIWKGSFASNGTVVVP